MLKNETLKEIGKYFLDLSKILIGLALVTPIMKNEDISLASIGVVVVLFFVGVALSDKGAKNE